jgi:hypothetical protein
MNSLTLAVAGGRKTQSIVDECLAAHGKERILVLTYTTANQDSLANRLAPFLPAAAAIDVSGWFSFLLKHWVRPYLPRLFADRALRGMQFEGDPGRYATGEARWLTEDGLAYRRHLANLATQVASASEGAVLDRLSRIYHRIWVDEVQDLNGYDLVVLEQLMSSGIELKMVGDIRQAILNTNVADPKYKQYKGVAIKDWFEKQAKAGHLSIDHQMVTWRCNQQIADLADSIFDQTWGFETTKSMNQATTGHDGVFAVDPLHAAAYADRFKPLCLRHSAASCRELDLPFMNIGVAKGLESERVLVGLTGVMRKFFKDGTQLVPGSACSLYVAVTRARSSVALVTEHPNELGFPVWAP